MLLGKRSVNGEEKYSRGKNEGAGRRERTQWCKGVEMRRACGWRYDEQGAVRGRTNERTTSERRRED